MDDLILAILVGLALAAVRLRDLLGAIAVLGAYSLFMAILWCRMNAVDVGFTEASVGAGISTVLMLAAISRVGRHERLPSASFLRRENRPPQWIARLGALFVCLVTAAVLMFGMRDMPRVGDPNAPANTHPRVVKHYIERSIDHEGRPGEIGVSNIVTAVLGDYRGYDTLGETVVIFTAALCVVLLLREAQAGPRRPRRVEDEEDAS